MRERQHGHTCTLGNARSIQTRSCSWFASHGSHSGVQIKRWGTDRRAQRPCQPSLLLMQNISIQPAAVLDVNWTHTAVPTTQQHNSGGVRKAGGEVCNNPKKYLAGALRHVRDSRTKCWNLLLFRSARSARSVSLQPSCCMHLRYCRASTSLRMGDPYLMPAIRRPSKRRCPCWR